MILVQKLKIKFRKKSIFRACINHYFIPWELFWYDCLKKK